MKFFLVIFLVSLSGLIFHSRQGTEVENFREISGATFKQFAAKTSQANSSCDECHKEVVVPDHQSTHKILCISCHKDHKQEDDDGTNPNGSMLKAPIPNICLECHDNLPRLHPVKGSAGRSHPVMGERDPLHQSRPFTCISCHNPHSSVSKKLFRYDHGKDTVYKGSSCNVCHWDKQNDPKKCPPRPVWDPRIPERPIKGCSGP